MSHRTQSGAWKLGVVLIASTLMPLGHVADAKACINAIQEFKHETIRDLKKAGALIREGRLRKAIKKIQRVGADRGKKKLRNHHKYSILGLDAGAKARLAEADVLLIRRDRLIAIAVVRSQGTLNRYGYRRRTKDGQKKALTWAVGLLLKEKAGPKASPQKQAWYAEALEASHKTKQARVILEQLAKDDLMSSPWGYVALARIQEGLGNMDGFNAMREACESRTSGKARRRICPKEPKPTSK